MGARRLAFKGLGLCLLGGALVVGVGPGCGRDEEGPTNTSSTTTTSVTTSDATTSTGSEGGMGGMGGMGGSANTGGMGGAGGSANTGGMGGTGGGECGVPEDCPPPVDECNLATCDNGQCGTAFVDQGTPLADQIVGDCNVVQCDGAGSTEDAADDNDLPDDANPCTIEGCDMGQVTTANVNAGTSCGVSLVCDGNGQCVGCVTEADCPGSNSECAQKTCTMGVCGVNFAAAGTVLAQQMAGDCKTDVCDGQGGTTTTTNDNDLPIDNVDCTQDLCSGGMIQHPPVAMGTACNDGGGSICDGAGTCVPCTLPTECPGQDTACSTRTCSAGQCGVSLTAAGTPVPGQMLGDCKLMSCDGLGNTVTTNDDNDVPVDGVTCTQDLCTAGMPSNPPAAVGTLCAQDGGRACTANGACSEVVTTLRVGSGAAALTSASTALFVDVRFVSDGSAVPLPINPVPLPVAAAGANLPITLSGTSTLEGLLSRSVNGSFIVFGGYGTAPGAASVSTTSAATVNRVIARIDALGNVNTTTALTAAFSGSNIRSAATVDGTAFWAGGNATAAANAGVQYALLGQTTSTQVLATPSNGRALFIDGGQLYGSSGSANFTSVYTVGAGLPTMTGQTATILAGLPTTNASPCQFVFFDLIAGGVGPDTVYIADDRSLAAGGGIQKYTFNGATWTLAQVLSTGFATGVRGLTGFLSNGAVVLVATTTETSANFLMKYIDDGSGVGTAVQLAQAPMNTVFRGTSLAPQ